MSPVDSLAQAHGKDNLVDGQGLFWLAISLGMSILALLCSASWLGLPAVLQELWRLVGDWAVVHEGTRRVDCAPWGLKRSFTIAQDFAEPGSSSASLSLGGAPGRPAYLGLSLWNGGVALSRRLAEHRDALQKGIFSEGNSVIELGCGQALVAMVVLELFPGLKHVVATDGSEDVLRSAEGNISLNMGSEANAIKIALLRWGHIEDLGRVLALNGGRGYDVVLGADLTYTEDHDSLISTILEVSHKRTEVWLTHEPRRRSVESLATRLRDEFQSVTEFALELTLDETGRAETCPIVGWHCVGKLAT